MIKRNIGLTELDAYAKRLTSKQVGMLYENRLHKKYKKSLFESLMKSDSDDIYGSFCLSVSIDDAVANGFTQAELISLMTEIDRDVKYKTTGKTLFFYTILPDVFSEMQSVLTLNDITFNEISED